MHVHLSEVPGAVKLSTGSRRAAAGGWDGGQRAWLLGPRSLSSERRQSSAVCSTATCTCDDHKAGLCVQAFGNYISLYALFTTVKNNLAIPMANTQKVGKKPLTRLCVGSQAPHTSRQEGEAVQLLRREGIGDVTGAGLPHVL